jgi:hypothetical protein
MNIRYILAVLSISLIGCAEQYNYSVESECNNEANNNVSSGLTKSVCNNDIDSAFFVSEIDLDSYLQFKKLSQKKEELTVVDIAPITDESGDIWAYVINYSEGWELISADKRYHPVIAQSPVGYFEYEKQIEPIAEWLGAYSEDIKLLRYSDNLSEVFTDSSFEIMASYQDFWNIITANQAYIEANRIKTRVQYDPDGRWELTDVVIDTVEYQRVDHLVSTHWHQDSPYNSFCPFKSYSLTDRAPAGCVAIAGAQTAYYLHGILGNPAQSPLNVFCCAQVPSPTEYYSVQFNDPQMYAYNFSSTAWDEMETDDSVKAALIAYVGIRSSTNYGDLSSGTLGIGSLAFWYFIYNHIGCNTDNINSNTYQSLYNNILNGLPVVASAISDVIGSSGGHAFIIDGYKNERIRITVTYSWVPTNPQNANYYEDQIRITYRPPINHEISMNWGWGNDYPYDAGWYSPAGDWYVDDYNYSNYREMIYNFENIR